MSEARAGDLRKKWALLRLAAFAGAWADLFDFAGYRVFGRRWARMRGHRFHRSTMVWFREGAEAHTRLTFLLPRLLLEYPSLQSVEMELEFYDVHGALKSAAKFSNLSLRDPFILDSQKLPEGLRGLGRSFDGTLLVKQTFSLPDKTVLAKQGLFGSAHTYIDHYKEGLFVTTLHDYGAFLPDQGVGMAHLGMIPAYCDKNRETFVLFHAAKPGIGKKDLVVRLYNENGKRLEVRLPRTGPFALRRMTLSELFPEAENFLGGALGQVSVKGLFRSALRRTAYGILDKKTGAYSLDHCFYSEFEKLPPLTAAQRLRMPKGWSNPFFVIEDETHSTSAALFQSAEDPDTKHVDLLVYDALGKNVLKISPLAHLEGDRVKKIDMREILRLNGIGLPFTGHAEVLYHEDPQAATYQKNLNLCVQYESSGRPATIIFDSDPWNAPKPVQNRFYRSACRVVCDDVHTTRLAISNCSFDYAYDLNASFNLSLVANGRTLSSKPMTLAPNATLFRPIEELFPDAAKLLKESGGQGLVTTTDLNCSCLTHLFFTEDRRSGALSVEHSLDV